jgi:hypothetical protein
MQSARTSAGCTTVRVFAYRALGCPPPPAVEFRLFLFHNRKLFVMIEKLRVPHIANKFTGFYVQVARKLITEFTKAPVGSTFSHLISLALQLPDVETFGLYKHCYI